MTNPGHPAQVVALDQGDRRAIGLAEHKMYVRDNNKFQKHEYTSTKAMRKLAKEWLYSGKHLFD